MADQTGKIKTPHTLQPLLDRPVLLSLLLAMNTAAQGPPTAGPAPTPPEEDIRPPRPPVEIPKVEDFPWSTLWISLAAAAVLAGLVWWLLKLRRKQRTFAPQQRALAALDAVDRERTRLEPGPLADSAAGVVRQFIADRFGIAAPARTTEEFLRALTSGAPQPLAAHQPLLQRFLQTCDAAKFAGAEFDNAERLELISAAFNFVRAAGEPQPEGGKA